MVIYWENKLYLHTFDRVESNRPETGQSDVSIVKKTVDNQTSVFFLFSTTLYTINENRLIMISVKGGLTRTLPSK